MTEHNSKHRPTEEFRDALEWEVSRALRRTGRLALHAQNVRRSRLLSAGRMVIALVAGAVLGAAPEQVRAAQQRNVLLETAQAEEQVAVARLQIARAELDIVIARVGAGAATRATLTNAENEFRAMELKVAAIRHNIEEIRVSSAPPRDDLAAPRIGGRDFVTERLRLQLPPAQAALVAAEEALKVVDIRLDQDQATPLEMTAAQSAVLQATGRLEILLGRISLREKFLAGSLTADAVERQAQILVLRHELKISEAALAVANSQLQLVRVRHRTGIVTQLDLMRMELDVLEKANEVDAKQLQLQLLERGGRGTRTDTVPRSGG